MPKVYDDGRGNGDDDETVVAKTIWGEIRNVDRVGMLAVACVIRNRAITPKWWGNGYREVCLQAWQFSCWNVGDPNRAQMDAMDKDHPQLQPCLKVARDVMNLEVSDITGGAVLYHATSMAHYPDWSHASVKTRVIGPHVFYKEAT